MFCGVLWSLQRRSRALPGTPSTGNTRLSYHEGLSCVCVQQRGAERNAPTVAHRDLVSVGEAGPSVPTSPETVLPSISVPRVAENETVARVRLQASIRTSVSPRALVEANHAYDDSVDEFRTLAAKVREARKATSDPGDG